MTTSSAPTESCPRQAQEEITRDGDLPGVFACGQVRIANYSIPVHLRDGDPATAIEMADHAACYAGEDVGYGTWGQIQIGAAYAHLARRELDEAAARLDNVLALPPGQRLATLTARLNEMTPALRRGPYGGDRQAAGLADHIRVFCDEATTVRALPAGKGGDR